MATRMHSGGGGSNDDTSLVYSDDDEPEDQGRGGTLPELLTRRDAVELLVVEDSAEEGIERRHPGKSAARPRTTEASAAEPSGAEIPSDQQLARWVQEEETYRKTGERQIASDQRMAQCLQEEEALARIMAQCLREEHQPTPAQVLSDHKMAQSLHEEEALAQCLREEPPTPAHVLSDQEMAQRLHEEEALARSLSDQQIAQILQEEEEEEEGWNQTADASEEHRGMSESGPGKAVLAVQHILEAVRNAKRMYPRNGKSIEAVAEDDMVCLAEDLLARQQEFRQQDLPANIDIGYHYTQDQNLSEIRTHGLLTQRDQQDQKIRTKKQGTVFGDGIYTANHPRTFQKYGTTGLWVGRLQGRTARVPNKIKRAGLNAARANTIIGNKRQHGEQLGSDGWPVTDLYDEIVLKTSSQCLPMVQYKTALLGNQKGYEFVSAFQTLLQSIVDEVFQGDTTQEDTVQRIWSYKAEDDASSEYVREFLVATMPQGLQVAQHHRWQHGLWQSRESPVPPPKRVPVPPQRVVPVPPQRVVPGGANHSINRKTLVYQAPEHLLSGIPPGALLAVPPRRSVGNEDCVICREALSECPSVGLTACHHVFHRSCLERALQSQRQCPICRKAVGAPQGKSPSGTMRISLIRDSCSGYREATIVLSYAMTGGTQKNYHENPGTRHSGKCTNAYLPNTPDGRDLLKRLKYSFRHGLTFTVGTSLTTGRANQCTWSGIHHKTSLKGGTRAHGYPDPSYFRNCNEELDAAGVPPSRSLLPDGTEIGVWTKFIRRLK